MDKILGVLGGVSPGQFQSNNDDDAVDKLSHKYTTILLCIFAVIVSSKQYVGDPINCWVPAHFTGNWEEYTNSYCWIKNTYYLPMEEYIPKKHEQKDMITYYQWVPLILLTQALFFYFPRILWRSLNSKTAIDVDDIVRNAQKFEKNDDEGKAKETMNLMVKQLDRFVNSREHYHASCTLSFTDCMSRLCCPICGRKSGNYLTLTYLLTKAIYITNLISQLFMLDAFLGKEYHLYGIDVIKALISGKDFREAERFPRVTMCDFQIRRLGNLQRYTVQCVLTINLFNEMIYLFIWFWLVFVAFVSCLSLLRWALRMMVGTDRRRFIKKHLQLVQKAEEKGPSDAALTEFVEDYLKHDGVFILRLIGHNADAITVTEFINALYQNNKKTSHVSTLDQTDGAHG